MSSSETRAPCPFCAEPILTAAIKCRFCRESLPEGWSSTETSASTPSPRPVVPAAPPPASPSGPEPGPPLERLSTPPPRPVYGEPQATRHTGSLGSGIGWILLLSILIGWIPLIGPLIAGIVGGKKSGGVINGLMAAVIPSLLFANLLVFLAGTLRGIPVLGSLVALGALSLAFAGLLPILLGALVGGALAGPERAPVSRGGLVFVAMAGAVVGYMLYSRLAEDVGRAVQVSEQVARGDVTRRATSVVDRTGARLGGLLDRLTSQSVPVPARSVAPQPPPPAPAAPPVSGEAQQAAPSRAQGAQRSAAGATRLLVDAGDSIRPFPCHVTVGGAAPVVTRGPDGRQAIEFGPTSQATYSFGPYQLPALAPGQVFRGRLSLTVEGSDNYVHVAGFGESVSAACDYDSRKGPADGRYPFPSVAYRSAAKQLEIAETSEGGRVDWVTVPFDLTLAQWHKVEFQLGITSPTAQWYSIKVDGKQVVRRENHGVIRPDDSLAVLIGATGSSSDTHVRYADIAAEVIDQQPRPRAAPATTIKSSQQ
jgi:hypothetical protein